MHGTAQHFLSRCILIISTTVVGRRSTIAIFGGTSVFFLLQFLKAVGGPTTAGSARPTSAPPLILNFQIA
jgi:hypothetical protein